MNDEPKGYFDKPRNVKRLLRYFYVICAALFGLDFIFQRHSAQAWEGWFGFYALYGFVACVVLVLLAKGLRKLVMRREDYFDAP
jgi:hypothetical protein